MQGKRAVWQRMIIREGWYFFIGHIQQANFMALVEEIIS